MRLGAGTLSARETAALRSDELHLVAWWPIKVPVCITRPQPTPLLPRGVWHDAPELRSWAQLQGGTRTPNISPAHLGNPPADAASFKARLSALCSRKLSSKPLFQPYSPQHDVVRDTNE